ncbi:TIGR03016 family PEP-CTERM system-associated outer membrane protein [Falsiroseomonas sp.]|uniref:TIGR03016 family PEP-CTERM system-associated outer membrane protein n=1 Tax=Falsiroseomonas sp. TaxID=2870721 RepID=UPI0035658E7A
MAERRTPRCRRRLSAALCVLIGAPALVAGLPAQAQQAAPGSSPLGLFGPSAPPPGPFGTPAAPGGVDSTRFWLPQLYPDLPVGGAPPAGAPPQVWSIRPSIEVSVAATDNLRGSVRDREADLYGIIRPQITLAADSRQLVGAFTYRPSLRLYMNNSDQNRLDHLLAGQGTATLVEDLLFLDVSGSGDARSAFGGFGETGELGDDNFDRQDRVQTTTYRISPYVMQRFGGLATARVGYAFRQSFQSGRDAFLPGSNTPFFTSQDFISHEGFAQLASGEDWGRLGWDAQTSWTTFEGSGVYDGAHRHLHILALRYQLDRRFALTAEGGWQDERYAGVRPFEIQEPVWSVGVRYTPNDDGFLSVRYGQRDGFESAAVDGSLNVGVRTRLFVSYNEQLGAPFRRPGESSGFGLAPGLRVDAFGNIVDAATGVPVSLLDDRLRSTQSNVFRTRRATIGLSQAWPRDTFTAALSHEERDPVAVAQGTTAFAEDTSSVTLVWTRELEPGLALTTSGRVGITEREGQDENMSYVFQAGLSKVISPRLSGSVQYQFSQRENYFQGGSAVQNTIIVTLRQLF